MALRAFIAKRFSRLLNSRWNSEHASDPHALGRLGERIARAHLIAVGRKILYCNYCAPHGGEIDIVARHGDVLTFVEVKTRRQRPTSRPLDAVDAQKRAYLRKAANSWLRELGSRNLYWRFDVVEVELTHGQRPTVTIVENAFPLGK